MTRRLLPSYPTTRRTPAAQLAAFALVACVAASAAAPDPAHAAPPAGEAKGDTRPAPDPAVTAGALLLAGKPLPDGSPLRRYRNATYRQYARKMNWTWGWFEKRTLVPLRAWIGEHLPGPHPKTVFYPFSGPDILNAVTFFPEAETYLLFGLEKVGRIPGDLAGTSPEAFATSMLALRESLDHIIGLNFFRTASMRVEVGAEPHNGVAALMAFFLTHTGHTIVGARYITLDDDGRPQTAKRSKWSKAVQLTFRRDDDPKKTLRTVYYFRGDISDHAWADSKGLQALLERQGPVATFLKAASYLMYEPAFDDIRASVLARSAVIVEESSGVPYHHLVAEGWDLSLYGIYEGPIEVFDGKCQPDLAAAIEAQGKGRLPFSFGYSHLPGRSHMIIARRPANRPVEQPVFDGNPRAGVRTHCGADGKQTVERKE